MKLHIGFDKKQLLDFVAGTRSGQVLICKTTTPLIIIFKQRDTIRMTS